MRRPLITICITLAMGLVVWLIWDASITEGLFRGHDERDAGEYESEEALRAAGVVDEGPQQTQEPAATTPELAGRAIEAEAVDPEHAYAGGEPLTLVGYVLDENRRPVRNAHVKAMHTDGRAAEARTDRKGRYKLPWGSNRNAAALVLYAKGPKGALGQGVAWLWPSLVGPWRVPTVIVREAAVLKIKVSEGGQPTPGAQVDVFALVQGEYEMGRGLVYAAKADADGMVTFRGAVAGEYVAIATLADGRRGRGTFRLKRHVTHPMDIWVWPRLDVQLTITDAESGAPVAGAEVSVGEKPKSGRGDAVPFHPALPTLRSDSSGVVVVPSLGGAQSPLSVRVVAQGYATWSLEIKADQTHIDVKLVAGATGIWRLVDGEVPPPADGTQIKVRPFAPSTDAHVIPSSVEVRKGHLIIPGAEHAGLILARTPQGAIALLAPAEGSSDGKAPEMPVASFAAPRTLDVTVRKANGTLAAGVLVTARTKGVYPASGSSDRRGRVRFTGLPARAFDLQSVDDRLPTTTVDLTEGDGEVEIILGRERVVQIHVTINGVPGIPDHYKLKHGEVWVETREDGARGVITLRTRKRDPGAAERGFADIRITAEKHGVKKLELISADEDTGLIKVRAAMYRLAQTPPDEGR